MSERVVPKVVESLCNLCETITRHLDTESEEYHDLLNHLIACAKCDISRGEFSRVVNAILPKMEYIIEFDWPDELTKLLHLHMGRKGIKKLLKNTRYRIVNSGRSYLGYRVARREKVEITVCYVCYLSLDNLRSMEQLFCRN